MQEIKTHPSSMTLFMRDLSASLLVFLISIPLSMAIAIASGMPPAAGLITGIAGGLIAAPFGGSRYQISGPAAGLTVLVAGIIAQTGESSLGISVALAGLIQLGGSFVGLANWFRAVPPSVIKGMLSGIGILIFASQFHVMLDDKTKSTGLENILSIPGGIIHAIQTSSTHSHDDAALIGIVTLCSYLGWQHFCAKRLPLVPSALVAVGIGSLMANALHLPIHFVQIPQNIFASLHWMQMPTTVAGVKSVIGNACLVAFIASCETLLTAAALDKMHDGKRTEFSKELRGQGLGNFICGLYSCLPMTGVMVRSGANIAGGANSRRSSIMVGVWLLIFTAYCSSVVSYIPVASLAALLVLLGFNLAEIHAWKEIKRFGRGELLVYITTVASIVGFDLLTGIVAGVVLSVGKLLYKFSILDLRLQKKDEASHIWLKGSATFLRLPTLHEMLEKVPHTEELHVHLEELEYIDHACLDLIVSWDKQAKVKGGCLVIDWSTLTAAYRDRRRTVRSTDTSIPPTLVAAASGEVQHA